ncbi:hypothetical protein C1701_20775 [Actinoalloteichus sp. AHMU CJ021]|uniref:Uncharacterized protein n=2 Tax=Actinoalloteichus cyanogriseus TaxID=2893586 RepID=A0ABT1JSN0_ACTCY|nr:hypothetical protein [Actinoalloteichus caeruleus]AUS80370.1 hypothetical protein C1701_20775 [Actinoalloteichus sp. AHMU CJ021]MCP2334631.1 hypothetical protein [Actinoalloteichus caeruleus DSM 43889]
MTISERRFSPESGPGVVTAGPPESPTVMVLDPAGEAVHGELPATWRSLSARYRVEWVRWPALPNPAHLAASLLGEAPVVLLTTRDLVDTAEWLATRPRSGVDAVYLLAGPALPEPPEVPDHFGSVPVRELDPAGTRNERRRPLPLGHPIVVAAMGAVLDHE